MEKREWIGPTLERLADLLKYPDKANEFGSKKVTEETYQAALLFLTRNMGEKTPAPRIAPTLDGGLVIEILEYWVDLILNVAPGGATSVKLTGDPEFFKSHGYEMENGVFDDQVFKSGVDLLECLRKKGPPDQKKPHDPEASQAAKELLKKLKAD